jgi:hypothetical protein
MDAIQLKPEDYTITINRSGLVTGQINMGDGEEYQETDITKTELGKILYAYHAHLFDGGKR